jgi:hypothetical protein
MKYRAFSLGLECLSDHQGGDLCPDSTAFGRYKVEALPSFAQPKEKQLENMFEILTKEQEEAKKLGIMNMQQFSDVQRKMEANEVHFVVCRTKSFGSLMNTYAHRQK